MLFNVFAVVVWEQGVSTTPTVIKRLLFSLLQLNSLRVINTIYSPFTIVDYRQGQLATLVVSGKWKSEGNEPARVALAPDGRVVAVGSNCSLYIYSTANAELLAHIPDVHAGNKPISQFKLDILSCHL